MFNEAHLITPHGKVILLTAADYQKVVEALALRPQAFVRPSLTDTRALVKELRGKYARQYPLTQALLDERRLERSREEAKIRRYARHS
jgi:hypothetical protein